MRYFDSHCHLNDEAFLEDLPEVIARAQEKGIKAILVLGYDLPSSRKAIEIAETGMLPCTVELSCFMGSYQNYHVRVGDTLVKITDNCPINKRVFDVGENAFISFKKECAHLL